VALSFSAGAFAKDGASVDFSFGYKLNPGDLGGDVQKDGINFDEAKGSVSGFGAMPERYVQAQKDAGNVSKYQDGGSMTVLELALNGRYDFMGMFFARAGFTYDMKVMGGETSWTQNGADGSLYSGKIAGGQGAGKYSQTWEYNCFSIPLTVGLNFPFADGKYNFYLGFGLTYAMGGYSLQYKGPTTKYKAEYELSDFGFNYVIGADAMVADSVFVLLEMYNSDVQGASGAAKVSGTANTYSASQVNLGGSVYRVGVRYALPL